MFVTVTYGETTEYLTEGQSLTFSCTKFNKNDISVTFGIDGYASYDGCITLGNGGSYRLLECGGKKLRTDLVITAGAYSNAPSGDSPFPRNVATASEMDEILRSATDERIGAIYKYVGPYTPAYTPGELYIVTKEY